MNVVVTPPLHHARRGSALKSATMAAAGNGESGLYPLAPPQSLSFGLFDKFVF